MLKGEATVAEFSAPKRAEPPELESRYSTLFTTSELVDPVRAHPHHHSIEPSASPCRIQHPGALTGLHLPLTPPQQ